MINHIKTFVDSLDEDGIRNYPEIVHHAEYFSYMSRSRGITEARRWLYYLILCKNICSRYINAARGFPVFNRNGLPLVRTQDGNAIPAQQKTQSIKNKYRKYIHEEVSR